MWRKRCLQWELGLLGARPAGWCQGRGTVLEAAVRHAGPEGAEPEGEERRDRGVAPKPPIQVPSSKPPPAAGRAEGLRTRTDTESEAFAVVGCPAAVAVELERN